jgi:serine/threonine-protein kinase
MRHVSGLDYSAASDRGDSVDGSWGGDSGELEDSYDRYRRKRRGADHDRWLGKVVDGRYRVVEVIGRGGMGVVYRVEHVRMGKIAAMKVLHHDLESDPEVSRRFRNEAAAVSRLTHPNTVQVFDFGTARGALYLIMEFVRGLDIGSIIDRDGPLPFERAAPLVAQIAAALAEAHEVGVVHRDLKPENILVTRTHGGHDFAKVLDFGLAKLGEREDPGTSTGRAIVGTPYYMSPEQIRGDEIDARADIYSLGALVYKLITGEPPFRAKTPVGVLTKHLTEPLVPPTRRRPDLDIPAKIDDVVGRAMAKKRRQRYKSVAELSADLAEIYDSPRQLSRSRVFGSGAADAEAHELAADIDYGIDDALRLRRADLDRYETSLRRRRWVRVLVVPLVLAGLAVAGLMYFRHLERRPLEAEAEPNDHLGDANRIATKAPVTAYLGKRMSKTQGDRDFYVVPAGEPRIAAVTAEVSAIPNIDIALHLYDPGGRLIDVADENGVGHPEAIHDRLIEGDAVVMVTHTAREPGDTRLPVENVSDPYRLVVTRRRPSDDREREPNNDAGAATAIRAGALVSGTLDRRADIDCFRFEGAPGSYRLEIAGAAGAPIRWSAPEAGGSERTAVVTLGAGSILCLERGDSDAPRDQVLPGSSAPYHLKLVVSE